MTSSVEGYVDVQASDVEELPEVAWRKGVYFQKYKKCRVCGVKYPRREMVRFLGAFYCTEFGCNDDIPGIIANQEAEANRPSGRNENDSEWG